MNNLQPSGSRDVGSGPEGDTRFRGVEERYSPAQLSAEWVCQARNKRFRNGRAETRGGITLLPWMLEEGLTPFKEVYGAFVFEDPNDFREWILIAGMDPEGNTGVWRTGTNRVCVPVPVPADVTALSAGTFKRFVQANSAIVMLRGLAEDCLACTNLEEGFKRIPVVNEFDVGLDWGDKLVHLAAHQLLVGDALRFKPNPLLPPGILPGVTYYVYRVADADHFSITKQPGTGEHDWGTNAGDVQVTAARLEIRDGAVAIPPATTGIFVGNRLVLVNGKDTVAASDIGDYARYAPLQASFRINEGDSYTLEEVVLFNEDTLIFFKSGNVQKVVGVTGDLSGARGPLNVTQAYGAVGAGSVVAHGAEVYWLSSELRIATLALTALNQEQGTEAALSDPLVQTFKRINAQYVAGARLAVFDGYLLCALPLDEAQLVSETEQVPAGAMYDVFSGDYTVTGLTAGQRYRYRQGAHGGRLVNGAEVLNGDCDFTADGTSVQLFEDATLPATGQTVTESVKAVLAEGVNNGVAVYDFVNQAWAGTDEGPAGTGQVVCVKDWLKFTEGGRPRLGFIGSDGWLHLYDEGYEDERLVAIEAPYVDVLVDTLALIADNDILTVNGGAVGAVANTGQERNMEGAWGASPLGGVARENLWEDANGVGGFNPEAAEPWDCPNTTPTQIDFGVRFTATNGVLPVIRLNTVAVPDGTTEWLFLDSHEGSEIEGTPIEDYVLTRGYACQRPMTLGQAGASRRFTFAGIQIGTWAPTYSIQTRVQGVGEPVAYKADETRDPLKWFAPHEKPDWDPTNGAGDYGDARREDYSWRPELAEDDGEGVLLGEGVNFDAVQEYAHRVPIAENGLWIQLEIVNKTGRLELIAVAMEGTEGEQLTGPVIG